MHRLLLVALFLGACSTHATETSAAPTSTATTAPPATSTTTSTTLAAETSTPPETGAAPGSGTLGYLGCSMTQDAVQGYHDLGGQRLWPFYPQGGGSIDRWSDPTDQRWRSFERELAANGASEIWLQLCITTSRETTYEMVTTIVAGVRERVGDLPLYIGWQPPYDTAAAPCASNEGPDIARGYALQAIADGLAQPDASPLGPLGPQDLQDDCVHANKSGEAKQGEQLLAFFG